MSFISVIRKGFFPSTGTPGVSPAFDSIWDDTSAADRKDGVWDTKSGSSFVTLTPSWAITQAAGASKNLLVRQYVQPAYGSLASIMAAPPSTPAQQILGPIARMKISATRGGSPISYGAYHFVTWWVAKVVDSAGVLRWVIGRSASGAAPGLTTLTARQWTGMGYIHANDSFLPASTDMLVLELGFRCDNGAGGGTVTFNLQVQFGDSAAFNLTDGSTSQGNTWFNFAYYVDGGSAVESAGGMMKPKHPTLKPKRFQSPPVPDRESSILNEFILNDQIL